MKTHLRRTPFGDAYCGVGGPYFVKSEPTCKVCAKRDARRLAACVVAALARPEALRWRDKHHPKSYRWDDGPCYYVARAIAAVDGHRGEVLEVRAGAHAVYVLHGVPIDGHGIYRGGCEPKPLNWHYGRAKKRGVKDPWAINWVRWTAFVGPPATLIRAIRRELRISA